jgi:hypothetical protein
MKYYAERNGLLKNDFSISLDELRKYFYQVYKYFEDKGFFNVAYKGVWKEINFHEKIQLYPPTMAAITRNIFCYAFKKR